MTIILHIVPDGYCTRCGARGYVERKLLLCLPCLDIKLRMERKKKLNPYAQTLAHIRNQLAEFNATAR